MNQTERQKKEEWEERRKTLASDLPSLALLHYLSEEALQLLVENVIHTASTLRTEAKHWLNDWVVMSFILQLRMHLKRKENAIFLIISFPQFQHIPKLSPNP